MHPAVASALLRRVEGAREAIVALTRELVQVPTVNPPGEAYGACVAIVAERLARRGFAIETIRAQGAPGDCEARPRLNVVARREGRSPGRCVHLNGHIDVVAPGEGWTVEPFAATVRDGRVYGRGTGDMKGGLAAAIVAAECVVDELPGFSGAIEISATCDEESGGLGGVAHLARLGHFSRPRVDHVIIPEPFGVDRICVGHRGVWWGEIETLGRIAHGSMPFLGDCAIRHMAAVLTAIERELVPSLARRETAMPVVPAEARRSTLNLAAIHGGLGEPLDGLPSPLVADRCRLLLDRRFPDEETLASVRAEVVALLDRVARERPGFRYALRDVLEVHPTRTPADAAVVSALGQSIVDVTGRPAALVCSPGSYDHKHVARIGGLEECVAYGPGQLELAHQPDEWVGIDDLVTSAQVMALATARLLEPA
jgi:succinyl-diaminopimelate desuccinylase